MFSQNILDLNHLFLCYDQKVFLHVAVIKSATLL